MEEKFEPLKESWFKPRETARYLIDNASKKYIFFLLVVTTFANTIVNGVSGETSMDLPLWAIFLGAVILSPVAGFLGHGLNALILLLFGKLAKGEAKLGELFKISIGASIPILLAFPFALAWAILDPQSYLDSANMNIGAIGLIASLVTFVAGIWCFVNLVIAVSEAHRFSIGKALFTLLFPILLLVIIIFAFVFAFLV